MIKLSEVRTNGLKWPGALASSALLHLICAAIAFWVVSRTPELTLELAGGEVAPAPPVAESLPREVALAQQPEVVEADSEEVTVTFFAQDSALRAEPTSRAMRLDDSAAPKIAPAHPRERPHRPVTTGAEPDVPSDRDSIPTNPGRPTADSAAAAGSGAGSAIGDVAPASQTGAEAGVNEPSARRGPGEAVDAAEAAVVDSAPTSAGTAANLLAYVPRGHVVTAVVRFDRLVDTEWADATETLVRPMPDYRALFGERDASIRTKIDMLVISTPQPRDATATTLVIKTSQSRSEIRELLANPAAQFAWSAAQGGLLGERSAPATAAERRGSDRRVLLSPWRSWYVLARREDLGGTTAPATGDLDTVEATTQMPKWLSGVRAIEAESGVETRGPALVVTAARLRTGTRNGRYPLPELALGVSSLPLPTRASLALELVKLGWLARGYLAFASEAEAREFVQSTTTIQQRVLGSHLISAFVERQHALNAVKGLTLLRVGSRVSFSTSLSMSDARGVISATTAAVAEYFGPR